MQFRIVRSSAVLTTVVLIAAVRCCDGQTTQSVQLPTFRSFGVETTVLVPDRGSVSLGRVYRSSRGRNRFGLPLGGRLPGGGLGFGSSGGNLSIHATIIDHNELDRAVLAAAARRRGAKVDVLGRPVDAAPGLTPAAANGRVSTLPAHRFYATSTRSRARTQRQTLVVSRAVNRYLRLGLQAEADGDIRSARIFYEMADEQGNVALNQRFKP